MKKTITTTLTLATLLLPIGCGIFRGKKSSGGGNSPRQQQGVDVEKGTPRTDLALLQGKVNTLDANGIVLALKELGEELDVFDDEKIPSQCSDEIDFEKLLTKPARGLSVLRDVEAFVEKPEDHATPPTDGEQMKVVKHADPGAQFALSWGNIMHIGVNDTSLDTNSIFKIGGNDQYLYWLTETDVLTGDDAGATMGSELYVYDRKTKILTQSKRNGSEGGSEDEDGKSCSYAKGTCVSTLQMRADLTKGQIAFEERIEDADLTQRSDSDLYFKSDFTRDGAKIVGKYDVFVGSKLKDHGESTNGMTDYSFDVETTPYKACFRDPS